MADTSDPGVTSPYVAALLKEMDLAARQLGRRRVETVYFGGGTPTLMPLADYARIMDAVRERFDLRPDAEVTTEANPETLTPELLQGLRDSGINRLSMGMQSAVPHVLATLDRAHTPGRVAQAVAWARAAGFSDVSLDLIYGTPGESMNDWMTSVDAALALEPDHVSAYSLIVEEGTPMARRMAAGELPYPDEDDLADKYLVADKRFAAAGLRWYEVSNWARPGHECRHNMVYWRGGDWWGLGAGAHSHVSEPPSRGEETAREEAVKSGLEEPPPRGEETFQRFASNGTVAGTSSVGEGTGASLVANRPVNRTALQRNPPQEGGTSWSPVEARWWNHRRPLTYEAALARGESPAAGCEHPTAEQQRVEAIMLGIRLAEGFDSRLLTPTEAERVERYVADGCLTRQGQRLVCTTQGRLIADGIVREVLD